MSGRAVGRHGGPLLSASRTSLLVIYKCVLYLYITKILKSICFVFCFLYYRYTELPIKNQSLDKKYKNPQSSINYR